jgi:hypothetical protein
VRSLFKNLALAWAAVIPAYLLIRGIAHRFALGLIPLAYLAALFVPLLGEALGKLAQVLSLWTGRIIPSHHDWPTHSTGLADLWGKRWNRWICDWFRQVIFQPLSKKPFQAIMWVFAFSGLMHETILNLPLYFLTDHSQFGSMMAYFGIQAAGVMLERKIPRKRAWARRGWAWFFMIAPCPLILNEAALRVMDLWPTN